MRQRRVLRIEIIARRSGSGSRSSGQRTRSLEQRTWMATMSCKARRPEQRWGEEASCASSGSGELQVKKMRRIQVKMRWIHAASSGSRGSKCGYCGEEDVRALALSCDPDGVRGRGDGSRIRAVAMKRLPTPRIQAVAMKRPRIRATPDGGDGELWIPPDPTEI